jgi:hypothetical protein
MKVLLAVSGLLIAAHLQSCARSNGQAGVTAPHTAPSVDACQQCADTLMSAFGDVISSRRPTINDIGRFIHLEDEFTIAWREMSEQDYFNFIHSDYDTTASKYAQRIQAAVPPGADLSRWSARMADQVCEVEIEGAALALTITNRPRCYVTSIRHEGTPLLE